MTVSVFGLLTTPFLMAQRDAPSASSNTRESIAATVSSLHAATVSALFDASLDVISASTAKTFASTPLSTTDTSADGTTGSMLAAEVKPEVRPAEAITATAKTSRDVGTRVDNFFKLVPAF